MATSFHDFCRAHGLIVDQLKEGRWVRVPTTDKPRHRNGAYKFLGNVGWCQNHAQSMEVSMWRPDGDAPQIDTQRIAEQAAAFERKQREGWARAAVRADALLADARPGDHNYLASKRLADVRGLVLPDGTLFVPMRDWQTNGLRGAQLIRWDADERRYDKKFLPGMRSKGAVFRLGSAYAGRSWLVEGLATGLSVAAALTLMRLRDSVVVCFSAGNLVHVARMLRGDRIVFADNDASGTGERAAQSTGLPYCMAPTVGQDANDVHCQEGLYALAALMRQVHAGVDAVP